MSRVRSTHGSAFKVLVGKPERNRPLARPTRRLYNTRMDLKKTGCEDVDWIHLAQDREQ
jgi:hypothetical protein